MPRLAALLLPLLLVACGERRPRAELVFLQSAEPETLDPALATDQVSMRVSSSLFEGLCRVNEHGRPEPGMAERWDISDDRKTYTFHLRAGTTWSDGAPVVAEDFIAAWRRVLTPETGADYASLLHVIRGARAFTEGSAGFEQVGLRTPDTRTLVVELDNPVPYFIDLCAFLTLAPVPLRTIGQHGGAWIKPGRLVGNGAYLLDDWRLDDRIRLRRNPAYWDAANVRLATVEIRPVQDAGSALAAFHTGQLREQPWFHTGPFLGTWFIRINTKRPPFTDPRVRRAFALAVDKRRIVDNITQLGENPAAGVVPPGTGADYQPPPGLDFDPAAARRLLAEAGFPDGKGFPRVEYLYLPLAVERNIAVELQAMWQKHLGITVNLIKQEQKVWLKSMRELDYDLCRSSWVGDYNDPSTFLDLFQGDNGQNRTGYADPEYDVLIRAAAAEADATQRNQIFQQAESRLIRDQAAVIPVYTYVGVQFYHANRLTGVRPNLIDDHPFRCMGWK
jgi:oligopeptide transport system substrate-binding protein